MSYSKWCLEEIPLPSPYNHPPAASRYSDVLEEAAREDLGDFLPDRLRMINIRSWLARSGDGTFILPKLSIIHDGKNSVLVRHLYEGDKYASLQDKIDTLISLAEEKELQGKIPQLYGILSLTTRDDVFVFEEWLDGYTDVLTLLAEDKLTREDVEAISKSMLDTVKTLHSLGYVHLDITLSNFMYNPATKDTRLIDFEGMVKTEGNRKHIMRYGNFGYTPPEFDKFFYIYDRGQMKAIDLYMLGMALLTLQTYDRQYPYGLPNELLKPNPKEGKKVEGTSAYQHILAYITAYGKQELLPLLERDPMKRRFP